VVVRDERPWKRNDTRTLGKGEVRYGRGPGVMSHNCPLTARLCWVQGLDQVRESESQAPHNRFLFSFCNSGDDKVESGSIIGHMEDEVQLSTCRRVSSCCYGNRTTVSIDID
jgi:hypothetical protein